MLQSRQLKFPRTLVACGVLFSSVLIAISAFFMHQAQEDLVSSEHWVTHTIEVENHIERLGRKLAEAEAGQRGYLLTGDDANLQSFQSAVGEIPLEIRALRELTIDNAAQQRSLQQADSLTSEMISGLLEPISLQRGGQRQEALTLVAAKWKQRNTEALGVLLENMGLEESRLLKLRQGNLSRRIRFHTGVVYSLIGLNLFLGGTGLFLFYRLAKAQAWITICAWSKTIEYEGKWLSFEKYLQERFEFQISHGISPEEKKRFGAKTNHGGVGPRF